MQAGVKLKKNQRQEALVFGEMSSWITELALFSFLSEMILFLNLSYC
jgi:hypothetical protein